MSDAPASSSAPLRIGVLGAARISPPALFTPAADRSTAEVVAIAARSVERARAQADEFGIPTVHDSYDALLADPNVDAVYNPLPPSVHAEWSIKALEAGKHVLCEKPFASNAAEAAEMVAAAERTGLVLLEAFHWRYHPMAARIATEVAALGPIVSMKAHFDVPILNTEDIRHQYDLAGGALMDLGCYPVQWLRFAASSVAGAAAEPTVTSAAMTEGNPGIDLITTIEMTFDLGAAGSGGDPVPASLHTAMAEGYEPGASLTVVGETATLEVTNPLHPSSGNQVSVTPTDGGEPSVSTVAGESTYHYQLDAFVDAVRNGAPQPTGGQDAVATMAVIDAAYTAAGFAIRGA